MSGYNCSGTVPSVIRVCDFRLLLWWYPRLSECLWVIMTTLYFVYSGAVETWEVHKLPIIEIHEFYQHRISEWHSRSV